MRDYKYVGLVTKKPEWEECVTMRVRAASLQIISAAFTTNLKRITSFSIMPAEMVAMSMRDSHLMAYVIVECGRKLIPSIIDQLRELRPEGERYNEVFDREATKLEKEEQQQLKEQHQELRKHGIRYTEEQLKLQPGMRESMDAILSSVIIESWTAFESLAGDLWVAGVDNEPGEAVSRLVVASRSLKKPDDNIRPETVFRAGINPKERYGSFLRAVEAVSFQTLWDIKKYYGIAFGESASQLFEEVDGGYIEVLAAYRNALTHSGGRADKKFKDRLTGRFAEFDNIKQDDPILLDGELANRLNLVAVKLGSKLLAFIDDILSPLPKTD